MMSITVPQALTLPYNHRFENLPATWEDVLQTFAREMLVALGFEPPDQWPSLDTARPEERPGGYVYRGEWRMQFAAIRPLPSIVDEPARVVLAMIRYHRPAASHIRIERTEISTWHVEVRWNEGAFEGYPAAERLTAELAGKLPGAYHI